MELAAASRIAVLAHLVAGVGSLLIFAVARPPAPPRLAGRRGLLAAVGRWAYWAARPLVTAARALGLSPDAVTWLGLLLSAVAAGLASQGAWGLAGLALLWGAGCDMIDGEVARATGRVSQAGAFLDSNLDRLSEIATFAGLAVGFPGRTAPLLAWAALAASLMVSYARARGEGLGVECPPFGLERPHRVALTLLPLLAQPFLPAGWGLRLLFASCAAIAAGAALTAAARMVVIHRLLRRAEGP
jgi:CDP-diacylglycerol--glycerol-3-phosphate 3-phosphatidyltransferase